MKKSILYILALTASLLAFNASAATYSYENTPGPGKFMDTYSTSWNQETETLRIKSTWSGVALSRIDFLISDGPSPWATYTHGSDPHGHADEQFLFYSVDLAAEQVTAQTYKGGRATVDTFNNTQGVSVTGTSIDLNLDHTALNALTAGYLNTLNGASYSHYRGAGFEEKIGVWYYMYDLAGKRVETLDIHNGNTSVVPVPAALFLFAPALAGFAAMRRKLTPENS